MIARQKSPNPCGTVIAPPTPAITGISPSSADVGTGVTITGTGFGSAQGTVTFNGITATSFSSWTPTSIGVTVPIGATSGNVVVTVAGQSSNGFPFTVGTAPTAAPVITSIYPNYGPVGTVIAITGTNFSSGGTVSFGGINSTPINWSDTLILAPIPAGATSGNVVVTTSFSASNGVNVTTQTLAVNFTQYTAFGDSITQGNTYAQSVSQMLTGIPFENRGLMGITSFEMMDRVYWLTVPNALVLYTCLIGTNNFPGTPDGQAVYRNSVAAAIAWLAVPNNHPNKINARDPRVTYTGTWHNQDIYTRLWPMVAGGAPDDGMPPHPPWQPAPSAPPAPMSNTQPAPIGKYTTEHGVTAEFKISGSTIYIFFTRWAVFGDYGWGGTQDQWGSHWGEPQNGGWFEVFVDDVSRGWYGAGGVATADAWNPPPDPIRSVAAYGPPWGSVAQVGNIGWPNRQVQNTPWWFRVGDLSPGEHDVRLETYTNMGNPGSNHDDKCSFEWAVGIGGSSLGSLNSIPRVYPMHILPRGIALGHPVDLSVPHGILDDVVSTMRSDGLTNIRGPVPPPPGLLWCEYPGVGITMTPPWLECAPGMDFTDGLHPSDEGQAEIAQHLFDYITGSNG